MKNPYYRWIKSQDCVYGDHVKVRPSTVVHYMVYRVTEDYIELKQTTWFSKDTIWRIPHRWLYLATTHDYR